MIRGRHSDSGETLLEGLVSISIVGAVLLVLIAAVTMSSSATTVLRSQSTSKTAGQSVSEAVKAYRVPKVALVTGGACNTAVTNPVTSIAQAAATANSQTVTLNSTTFSVIVLSSDASGTPTYATYPCSNLAGHPSGTEVAVAMQVVLNVSGQSSSVNNGRGTRNSATFPTDLAPIYLVPSVL